MLKRIVCFILVFCMLLSNFGIVEANNESEESINNLGNVSTIKEKRSEYSCNYTEEYMDWLKLSDEEKEQYEVIPRKYEITFEDVNYENNTTEAIPNKFDLRDVISVPIRNQEGYGLCWDFASVKSLETYLALNGYGDYDFSELYIDYMESEEFGNYRKLHSGGNFSTFEDYVINYHGPISETEVPYNSRYTTNDYDNLLSYNNKIYVGETVNFPTINKKNKNYTEEELKTFRDNIKKHIMTNGSVFSSICSSETNTDGSASKNITMVKYNGKWVLNYQGKKNANHSVSLIGWDDNFSKYNFPEECRPQNDGAYIAMNSWGDKENSCPVFYISYEDLFVEKWLSGVTSASTDINKECEKIQFEDKNFYNEMKNLLGKKVISNDDGKLILYVSKLAIDETWELELENKNISNLKGIEKFKNLKKINLSNNGIEKITYLENLEYKYIEINLSNNNIKDVSALKNCYIINISNNPINNGIDSLKKVINLKMDNCNLTDKKISQISNLSSIRILSLKNNQITDVSGLKNAKLTNLDISNNKIKTGIEDLYTLNKLSLSECSLDNSIIQKVAKILGLTYLDLSNNKITDVTGLKKLNIYNLNLSGNKNIKLETVPIVFNGGLSVDSSNQYRSILNMENCNIQDISFLRDSNVESINLSNNPISNISAIKNMSNIKFISLENTKVTDVSDLKNIETIKLSNNEQLVNLDKLGEVSNLYLENCGLSNATFLNSLEYISSIYLKNNKIEKIDKLKNKSLEYMDFSNNKIKKFPDLSKLNYYYLDLSNNEIDDISKIEDYIGVNERGVYILLAENKIKKLPEIKKKDMLIDVSYNNISEVSDNGYISYSMQEISENYNFVVNEGNRIPMPNILVNEYKNRYKNNSKIIAQNCTLDYNKSEIIIEPTKVGRGQATIIISGDSEKCKANGTGIFISYNATSSTNEENLKCEHEFENGTCKKCGKSIFKSDLKLDIQGSIIKNIPISTEISVITNSINDEFNKVIQNNGVKINSGIIKTGMVLKIMEENNTLLEYVLVVKGDTNGDGTADIKDILAINKHRLNKVALDNEYKEAADVNQDKVIDIKDILQLNKYRLGKIQSL